MSDDPEAAPGPRTARSRPEPEERARRSAAAHVAAERQVHMKDAQLAAMKSLQRDEAAEWPGSAAVDRPVVLVAHGSPDERSPEAVRAIAAAAGAHVGFLEFNKPDPVDVFCALADEGVERAIALPLLLTDAYHSRTDVPEVARRAVEARPGLVVDVARPVGDEALAAALVRGLPEEVDGLAVLAAGTRVDEGREHVDAVAAEAGRLLGVPSRAGFASGPGLTGAEAVEDLRSRGCERVAAACYFIAPGKLCDTAVESARSAGVVHVGAPLGTAPELLSLIAERAGTA